MPWRSAFAELQRSVRHLIWASAIFAVVIGGISILGLGLAWYSVKQQIHVNRANIEQNQQNIIALCREINEHNKDIRTLMLDFGLQPYQLTQFLPQPCTSNRLQRKFHN